MKIKFLCLSVLFLGLSACGKKLEPLTATQKAEFSQTLAGIADPLNAAQAPTQRSKPIDLKPVRPMMNLASSNPEYIPADLNDDFNNNCESNFNYSGTGDGAGLASMMSASGYIRDLNGLVCPITLNLDLSMKMESMTRATIGFALNYDIRHVEMKQVNDITGFAISGSGDVSGSQSGGTLQFQSTGNITSQRNGKVDFSLNANGSGDEQKMSFEVKMGMVFASYTAELKVVGQGDPSSQNPSLKYFLNDQEITEQEFAEFFNKFSDPRKNHQAVRPTPEYPSPIVDPARPQFLEAMKKIPVLSAMIGND